MSEEFVLEAFSDKRYAPSLKELGGSLFDPELEKELNSIPDKLAFKIGEVADLLGIKAYVLRYWETEFEQLRPPKSVKNQRAYSKKDVEVVMMIKKLLYRDRFSIEGARSALRRLKRDTKQIKAVGGALSELDEVRHELEDLVLHIVSLKLLVSGTS